MRFARLSSVMLTAIVVAACAQARDELAGTDLGAGMAPDLTLADARSGATVTLSGLRGKVVALTFLYTSCPDTCPLTAEHFRQAQRDLGSDADRVVFVAVSIDPERDTPDAVRAFSRGHGLDRGWHYLIAPRAQLAPVWQAYGIGVLPDPAGGPTITHQDAIFLIDAQGRERVLLRTSAGADDLIRDLRILLRER